MIEMVHSFSDFSFLTRERFLGLGRLLDSTGSISLPISEPLANCPEQGADTTLVVIHPESDTVVVSELELGEVTVQVFLVAMLIDALEPPLEQAEEALDGVRVDREVVGIDVLTEGVVNSAMSCELFPETGVMPRLIRHQPRLARDALANDGADLCLRDLADMEGSHLAAALDQRQNRVLVARAALRDGDALLAPDERLVRLHGVTNGAAQRAESAVPHRLPDAVTHEPRCLERDAKDAVKL